MGIGERIRHFGLHTFGKIKDFAIAMGMAPPNLQKYMNNEREPGIGILQKMQNLGCSIDWLISGEGSMHLPRSKRIKAIPASTVRPEGNEIRVIGSIRDMPTISLEKVSLDKLQKAQVRIEEDEDEN